MAATTALLVAATGAHAALPHGTLSYIDRVATVNAGDDIEIWLRLTLDAGSSPLVFSNAPLTGFADADLPTTAEVWDAARSAFVDVALAPGSVSFASLHSWYGCQTTFFTDCDTGGEYALEWATPGSGRPVIHGNETFSLAPGASYDFLFGTLHPRAGRAAPGTYRLFTTGVQLHFEGFGLQGEPLTAVRAVAWQCDLAAAEDCAFTRTVAVDEPAMGGLLAAALAAALAAPGGGSFRRRQIARREAAPEAAR